MKATGSFREKLSSMKRVVSRGQQDRSLYSQLEEELPLITMDYNQLAEEPSALVDLPAEILGRILQCGLSVELQTPQGVRLDDCSAVCLALTCRRFWGIFKKFMSGKGPILLNSYCPTRGGDSRRYLVHMLLDWMGRDLYRAQVFVPWKQEILALPDSVSWAIFLSKEVYGNWSIGSGDSREINLGRRYKEWAVIRNNSRAIFPHPHALGKDWYHLAVVALQNEVSTWPSFSERNNWNEHQKYAWEWYERSSLAKWLQKTMKEFPEEVQATNYPEKNWLQVLRYDRARHFPRQKWHEIMKDKVRRAFEPSV